MAIASSFSCVWNLIESTTSSGWPAEWERQRESWVRIRYLSGGRYVDRAKLLFGRCVLNSGFVLFVKHTWPPLIGILLHIGGPELSGPVRFCFVCIRQIYMYSLRACLVILAVCNWSPRPMWIVAMWTVVIL